MILIDGLKNVTVQYCHHMVEKVFRMCCLRVQQVVVYVLVLELMESEDCTPSHAQAIKIRKFSAEGRLNEDVLLSIMAEEKPNQVEKWKIPKNRLKKYFPSGTSQQKMEETIIKALELYRKREKSRER